MNHTMAKGAMTVFLVGALLLVPAGLAVSPEATQIPGEPVPGPDLQDALLVEATAGLPVDPAPAGERAGERAVGPAPRVHFEPNLGQSHGEVAFLARANGYTFFLTEGEAVFVLPGEFLDEEGEDEPELDAPVPAPPARGPSQVVRMRFEGAQTPAITGQGERLGKSNYFIGNDPEEWTTNVPHFDKVLVEGLWPGIDVVFLATEEGAVRFDFHVHPGADPDTIQLGFEGASASMGDDGAMVLRNGETPLMQFPAPYTYQETPGLELEIPSGFLVHEDGIVGFHVQAHDPALPLVIDPMALGYSTYFGGSSGDFASDIGVDAFGQVYLFGETSSEDLPIRNPYQPEHGGPNALFVTKFTPAGDELVYSTYISGSDRDDSGRMAIDDGGNVYLTGVTFSSDFPLAGAFQSSLDGLNDAFVTKLAASGDSLVFSTYLGGSSREDIGLKKGIALDDANNVYVTGTTDSFDFPVHNAFQDTNPSGRSAFVSKFDSSGDSLAYSTYLGGSASDSGYAITVGPGGNAFVTGTTASFDFPTISAFQATKAGDTDAFVTKLSPTGDSLDYSTYLGGSDFDSPTDIALDPQEDAYVSGVTHSSDFPVLDAFQGTNPDSSVTVFVTKLASTGDRMVYSTYFGGTGTDNAQSIHVDRYDQAFIAGITGSVDFPTVEPYQATHGGSFDVFVAMLDPSGTTPVFSTYLGGTGDDRAHGIAVGRDRSVHVAGSTLSGDFPTQDPYQSLLSGDHDAFTSTLIIPPCGTPGPDDYGYVCDVLDGGWTDISDTGTLLELGDDTLSGPIDLTGGGELAPFLYHGRSYTEARVSSNGFLVLGDSMDSGCCRGPVLPDTGEPDGVIAGYWTDLDPASGGTVHHQLTPEEDPVVIVQFTEVPLAPAGDRTATFQIVLNQATNEITVRYGPTAGRVDNTATTGIEDHDGSSGLTYRQGEFHSPGNGMMDAGDGIYLNLDADDSHVETVEVRDVRIARDGSPRGEHVTSADPDFAYGLVTTVRTKLCYDDQDADTELDINEPLYLKNGRITCDRAEVGDMRLAQVFAHEPGSFVADQDPDLNQPLLAVENTRLVFVDDDADGVYDLGEPVYLKLAGDGSGTTVESGDYRLTPSSGGGAFTWVLTGHPDQGASVSVLPGDPHIDTPHVLAYHDSQYRSILFDPPAPHVPSAPVAFGAAIASDNTVTLSWSEPEDNGMSHFTDYLIYRGATKATMAVYDEAPASTTLYLDTGVGPGETWHYAVSATNAEGESPTSDAIQVDAFDVPSPPQNVGATGDLNAITLTWDPPADDGGTSITGYIVQAGDTSGGPYNTIGTTDAVTTGFTETGLADGATRYYVVIAENDAGRGDSSPEASATTFDVPTGPQDLEAFPGDGIMFLDWSPPADDGGASLTGYNVYGGDSTGGPYSLIGTTGPDGTTFNETGLVNGEVRCYVVTAENEVGESEGSDEACATPMSLPGAPLNVTATPGPVPGAVNVSWEAPADDGGSPISSYIIYRDGVNITSGPDTNIIDTGLADGTTYTYHVTAVNELGEGPPSDTADATTWDVPTPPLNLTAAPGPGVGELTISWIAPVDDGGTAITQYPVYASSTPGGPYSPQGAVSFDLTSFIVTGLDPGETRCYVLSAENDVGESVPSDEACATAFDTPSAPQAFDATTGPLAGSILLEWSGPDSDGGLPVTGYKVYRADAPEGPFILLADVSASTVSFNETGLGDAVERFYHVRAVNDAGEGDPTPTRGSTTQPADDPSPLAAGRSATAAFWQGHYAYVIAGRDAEGNATDTIQRFDPVDDEAVVLNVTLPSPRLGVSAVWGPGIHDHPEGEEMETQSCHPSCPMGRGFIFGGLGDGFEDQSASPQSCHPSCPVGKQILIFDPEEDDVSSSDSHFSEGRFGTSAVFAAFMDNPEEASGVDPSSCHPSCPVERAFIFGGFAIEAQITAEGVYPESCHPSCPVGRQIIEYDPVEDTLEQHDATLPESLGGTSAIWDPVAQVAYIFGGRSAVGAQAGSASCDPGCSAAILRFDPVAGQVDVLPVELPSERWNTSAAFSGRHAYVIGGENETGLIDEIVRFDPENLTVEVVSSLPTKRTQTSAVFDGKDVYIFGGLEEDNETTDEIVRYTPGAPQKTQAEAGPGVGQVTVTWGPPPEQGGTPLEEYRVYRSVSGGLWERVAVLDPVGAVFVDTGLGNGTMVSYRVSAVNEIGEGPQGDPGSVRTFDLPGEPRSLSSAPGPGVGELRLSWEHPEDDGGASVAEYVVYRAEAPGGPFLPIGTNESGSLTFTDSGLDPLDIRYYQVAATNLVGEGPATEAVEGRTFDPLNIYVTPNGPITIQQAAKMIAEGGTIYLAPGVYPEEVGLETDNVTIQAGVSDGGGPLSLGSGASGAPVIDGGIKVTGATSFALLDVQVDATKGGSFKGVALSTDGASTVRIVNATFRGDGESKGPGFFPGLVDLRGVEDLVFTGNTLEGDSAVPGSPSGLRVQYAGDAVSVLVSGNEISGMKGAGVAVNGSDPGAVIEIEGNDLSGSGDGVHVFNALFGELSVTRNTVEDHASVGVRFSGTVEGDPVLRYNALTGNDVGVASSGGLGSVDARHNWWGHAGGPLAGDQANMLGVDYTPWCVESSCGLDEDLVDPVLP